MQSNNSPSYLTTFLVPAPEQRHIRIGEVGEAGIVSACGVEPGNETSVPGSDRHLVPDLTDLDPMFEQTGPRGLEVRDGPFRRYEVNRRVRR